MLVGSWVGVELGGGVADAVSAIVSAGGCVNVGEAVAAEKLQLESRKIAAVE